VQDSGGRGIFTYNAGGRRDERSLWGTAVIRTGSCLLGQTEGPLTREGRGAATAAPPRRFRST
jgi:hypothetical protein